MSVLNAVDSGNFSSDQTVREYAADMWRVNLVPAGLRSQQVGRSRIPQWPFRAREALTSRGSARKPLAGGL